MHSQRRAICCQEKKLAGRLLHVVTFEGAWLLNIEDFVVVCDTVRSAACLPTFRNNPPGRIFYQFKEYETRNFCPKTGGKRLFREIRVGKVK